MNKFKIIAASLALGVIVGGPVLVQNSASATAACVVVKESESFGNFTVNADQTITGTFVITGPAGCTLPVSVMTWNADTNLLPADTFYTTQTVFDVKTQTFGLGKHYLTVKLPVCSTDPKIIKGYQADVVASPNPPSVLTAPGTPGFYNDARQADGSGVVVDAKVGNSAVCPTAQPPVTPTPETPAKPAEVTAAPKTLPVTGPASVTATFVAVTSAASVLHRLVMRRRD